MMKPRITSYNVCYTKLLRRCLSTFGRELGLAFQLKDDALD